MIRGTTPTFKLSVKDTTVDLTEAQNIYATFKQKCGVSITKTGNDVEVAEHEVDVYLSQEETLKFREGDLDIQLNWTYQDGKRACSNVIRIHVADNLIGSVLK